LLFLVGSFLILKELGEELFVSNMSILGGGPVVLLSLGVELLSSESLLSNKSLDLWSSIENFFDLFFSNFDLLLNLSHDNILSDIVLFSKSKSGSNVTSSLRSKSSWSLGIGESSNFTLSLLKNFKEKNSEVWSGNATSD